jgi:hypothetical protein
MVLIQKEILCRLNIIDVNKQYCSDYKKMRMDELKKQFHNVSLKFLTVKPAY